MDFFYTVRQRSGNGYTDKMGPTRFLKVPKNDTSIQASQEVTRGVWFKDVQNAAGATETEKGHIVFFVHGFNTDQYDMLERHRKIRSGLEAHGYKGAVVSFDWPSDGSVLGYKSDRRDARLSADKLFKDGITKISRDQTADCMINIHIIAHSMGSFLLREAFDYADDDHKTAQKSWTVSQIALVAADISSKSMALHSPKTSSLMRHCTRITNYFSPYDDVLLISEVKRIGVSRRLGRVGMPEQHHEKAVNLYCGEYFAQHRGSFGDGTGISHRWYFESPRFYEDLFHTLEGKLDRRVIPTRSPTDQGNLGLI